MFDPQNPWRFLITSLPLQALGIGLLATLLSSTLWSLAPASFVTFDHAVYDIWLGHRTLINVHSSLAIVARDPASEERFGTGPWDRAVLAEMIVAIHEAGAAAIGIDHRLDHASPAQLGGAASDALLLEALRAASPVVLVHNPNSLLRSDTALYGHVSIVRDLDRVSRRIALSTSIGTQPVPAFAVLLYNRFHTEPTTRPSRPSAPETSVLINPVGDGSLAALQPIQWSSAWHSIKQHDERQLTSWFRDKIVVIQSNPPSSDTWLLPSGAAVDGMTAHLHLLNALLNDQEVDSLGLVGRFLLALLVSSLAAWSLLHFRGALGLLLVALITSLYGALIVASLSVASLVTPVALPLTATLLVLLITATWANLTASQRVMLLERDMIRIQQESAAVREALILREDRAEALQEDLDTAKETMALSAGQQEELAHMADLLRAQLAEARTQEQDARQRLEKLDRQLCDLRTVGAASNSIGDVELDRLQTESRQFGIVTQDRSLLRLFHDLKKGAKSPLTVLLLGEPGTGKELFARAIHRLSPRSGKPFITVNMAAISPELFESELFGHMKGSFTGATADRRGYFGLADHGTIFLDEIGDMRMDHQSKLLRVLQDKSFYRVGATSPTTVDVRIVAATNRDLQKGVSEGSFREDLYFRLTGLVFTLPPLRQRPGDIPLLAEIFLSRVAEQAGKPVPKLTHEALRVLTEYDWKGNVRELLHCVEQAVTLNDAPLLTRQTLRLDDGPASSIGQAKQTLPDSASDTAVLNCLREYRFDMQATAKRLGWDRSTVTQRLKGLCFQALVEADGNQAKAALAIAGDTIHLRTAELKLRDYYNHLQSVIDPFATAEEALADCKRRFKNLQDRHFESVETLVRRYFEQNR